YTRWLGALRSLSASETAAKSGIPQTAAWHNRILSSQLGSWAQLRHDTILYVKQSYSTGAGCDFPDAYVDPYPEFYARLGSLAEAVSVTASTLPDSALELKNQTSAWAQNFKAVTSKLEAMAKNQLTGAPHSQELLDFVNDAVKWEEQQICGQVTRSELAGWYLKLHLNEHAAFEYDPTVADVHTQPTDEAGNDVGRVLHVGTGTPRLMVVTAETCSGPRAYAGLAFSYGEHVTKDWERLTDDEWAQEIQPTFPDVSWMSDVLAD
ncbi:MAG: hypothetical protein RJA70_4488, partial [Pseudomonadota bacterium]